MDADKLAKVQSHVNAIAALLYEETDPKQVQILEGIEQESRGHLLEPLAPKWLIFYPHEQRYKRRAQTPTPKHHRTTKHDRGTSQPITGETAHSVESLPVEMLSAGECQCVL